MVRRCTRLLRLSHTFFWAATPTCSNGLGDGGQQDDELTLTLTLTPTPTLTRTTTRRMSWSRAPIGSSTAIAATPSARCCSLRWGSSASSPLER